MAELVNKLHLLSKRQTPRLYITVFEVGGQGAFHLEPAQAASTLERQDMRVLQVYVVAQQTRSLEVLLTHSTLESCGSFVSTDMLDVGWQLVDSLPTDVAQVFLF